LEEGEASFKPSSLQAFKPSSLQAFKTSRGEKKIGSCGSDSRTG